MINEVNVRDRSDQIVLFLRLILLSSSFIDTLKERMSAASMRRAD